MGQDIETEEFEPGARERFRRRLDENLETLRELLTSEFGQGESSLGAELEMSLVDDRGRPALVNRAVLERLNDPAFTLELNRFNLEYNAPHTAFTGRPFSALRGWLEGALVRTRAAAAAVDAKLVTVGIVPTLLASDLGAHAMSDSARYRVLERELLRRRQAPFHIRIDGEDPLDVQSEHVTYEGANTSLQFHLRVRARDFAHVYNAAQLATAPALALAGNSPIFLERRLWDETRVALFKQSVDHRQTRDTLIRSVPRVDFGTRWIESAYELFEESVALHEPLLPICSAESAQASTDGGTPLLPELRLHHGTVWKWNRAIYDPVDHGHLRIEFRALPSGPTVSDMLANGAFLIGLTLGLANGEPACSERLAFDLVHENFYRAAQHGLQAILTWSGATGAFRCKAADLLGELVSLAEVGLLEAGIAQDEVGDLMDIMRNRLRTGQTGAQWQRQYLRRREQAGMTRRRALERMLRSYIEHSTLGEPVHCWPND